MRMPPEKLSDRKMALLTRKLAYAYEGGIPVKRALELIIEENRDRTIRNLAQDIANAIECGYSLEDALRANSGSLDAFFIDLVAAGERSGRLSEALETLNIWYEEQMAFRRMLAYHFSYYIILFLVISFFLYPLIAVVLQGASLMVLVRACIKFAICVVIVLGALRLGVIQWVWRHFSAHAWPMGKLTRSLNLSRFCRVLALTYGHLSFTESWTRAVDAIWDRRLRSQLARVPGRIREGAGLGEAVVECPSLPDMVKQMIIAGERTGNTDECFLKASDYLRKEAMHGAQMLSLSLGTVIIIAMTLQYAAAVAVGFGRIAFW